MEEEYSIYYTTKRIVISNQIGRCLHNINGLIIKYEEPDELAKLLDFFHSSHYLQNLFIYGDYADVIFNTLTNHYTLVEAAGGLVQNSMGDFLIIRRNEYWDLPKGKGDAEETSQETALREVSEECGISPLTISKPLITTFHIYIEKKKRILKKTKWYAMSYNGDGPLVPQEDENITEALWVNRTQIPQYLNGTYNSVKDVFKAAGVV